MGIELGVWALSASCGYGRHDCLQEAIMEEVKSVSSDPDAQTSVPFSPVPSCAALNSLPNFCGSHCARMKMCALVVPNSRSIIMEAR